MEAPISIELTAGWYMAASDELGIAAYGPTTEIAAQQFAALARHRLKRLARSTA